MITLPDLRMQNVPSRELNLLYGAAYWAARYCGFEDVPYSPRGHYLHGWHMEVCNEEPLSLVGDYYEEDQVSWHWVFNERQANQFMAKGFHAEAIGHLFNYLPELPVSVVRQKNSLLVMPYHSLYGADVSWQGDPFIEDIIGIKDDFDLVAVSLHHADFVDEQKCAVFRDAGIEVIQGACGNDMNSVLRMQYLFNQFEYVTSNGVGSHMVYSCFHGCKFSLFGHYRDMGYAELENSPVYQRYPHLADMHVANNKAARVKEMYPWVFCEHPAQAKDQEAWGQEQMGVSCRKSPERLRELFCWPEPLMAQEDRSWPSKNAFLKKPLWEDKEEEKSLQDVESWQLMENYQDGSWVAAYVLAKRFYVGEFLHGQDVDQAWRLLLDAAGQGYMPAVLMLALWALQEGRSDLAVAWIHLLSSGGCEESKLLADLLNKSDAHAGLFAESGSLQQQLGTML